MKKEGLLHVKSSVTAAPPLGTSPATLQGPEGKAHPGGGAPLPSAHFAARKPLEEGNWECTPSEKSLTEKGNGIFFFYHFPLQEKQRKMENIGEKTSALWPWRPLSYPRSHIPSRRKSTWTAKEDMLPSVSVCMIYFT